MSDADDLDRLEQLQADRRRDAADFLTEIEMMLGDDDRYQWAADTLEGIHETVTNTGRVSEGQRRAVDRIAQARTR